VVDGAGMGAQRIERDAERERDLRATQLAPQQPEDVAFALAQRLEVTLARCRRMCCRLIEQLQHLTGVAIAGPGGGPEQRENILSLIHKNLDGALRRGERQRLFEGLERALRVVRPTNKRL